MSSTVRLLVSGVVVILLTSAACRSPQQYPRSDAGDSSAPSNSEAPAGVEGNTPTAECKTHRASLSLSVSAVEVRVGDVLTVTAKLSNEGCALIGLPKYYLSVDPRGANPVLDPSDSEPISHSTGLREGRSDSAEFTLRAVGSGRAALSANVTYEVHLGYPGPAYWGGSASRRIVVTVVD